MMTNGTPEPLLAGGDLQVAIVPRHPGQVDPTDRITVVVTQQLYTKLRAQWRIGSDEELHVTAEILQRQVHIRPDVGGRRFIPYNNSASRAVVFENLAGMDSLTSTSLSQTLYEVSRTSLVIHQPQIPKPPIRKIGRQNTNTRSDKGRPRLRAAPTPDPVTETDPRMLVVTQVGTDTHTLAIPVSVLLGLILKYKVPE